MSSLDDSATVDRRLHMEVGLTDPLAGEKGLFNNVGLNHCFINVVIQTLWHLDSFRRGFAQLPRHNHPDHDEHSCVRCALAFLWTHYEFSDETVLPPDALRSALAVLAGDGKFGLNQMSDAEEALEEILKFLHCDAIEGASTSSVQVSKPVETAPDVMSDSGDACPTGTVTKTDESRLSKSLDTPCHPPCLAHRVFGLQMMDQKVCTEKACAATSDPEMVTSFMYRIYVDELRQQRQADPDLSFESMLRESYRRQAYSCPHATLPHERGLRPPCKGPAHIDRWLLNQPAVVTLMCAWSNPEPDRNDIATCFSLLPTRLYPERFLQVVGPMKEYRLSGFIGFYGNHYMSVFYSSNAKGFVMLDDRKVTRLGEWIDVVARCCKGKLQPTVVLYEAMDDDVATDIASCVTPQIPVPADADTVTKTNVSTTILAPMNPTGATQKEETDKQPQPQPRVIERIVSGVNRLPVWSRTIDSSRTNTRMTTRVFSACRRCFLRLDGVYLVDGCCFTCRNNKSSRF